MASPYLPNDLPEELRGERILVRTYRVGDGHALYEAVDESREHILPWMPWGPSHNSDQASEALVVQFRHAWDTRTDLPLGIWNLTGDKFIGGTGLHRIDWSIPSFEIGYWIRESESGKGYVTEAVQLLTDLAFRELGANRVFIRCAEGNTRSSAIPRRLGFVQEGTLRNSIKDAYGNLHHALVFSMLPEEYAEQRAW